MFDQSSLKQDAGCEIDHPVPFNGIPMPHSFLVLIETKEIHDEELSIIWLALVFMQCHCLFF